MSDLLDKAKEFAEAYLNKMNNEKIQVGDEARKNLSHLDFDLQQ